MNIVDLRLDEMIAIADAQGATLDDVIKAVGRAPYSDFKAVSDNPSLLPLYIKSRVSP